ncbi:MAG: polynucleotide kinase-phosphatase [Planctomycetes bacterium]|nr:polynucleotide kinase-phosphatase [Planctomycetota bacterium]
MERKLPALSLVVLVGPSGSGKSTFAARHFRPSEVLSSDWFRSRVRDDENDMSGNADAFEALHFVARKRLAAGLLTVIDATNVQREARAPLVALAREFHVVPVAIVLGVPQRIALERNASRPERVDSEHYVRKQYADLRRSLGRDALGALRREGFASVHVLGSLEEIDGATFVREPLWTDRRVERGPFDIIGDVHGCLAELTTLLDRLGYVVTQSGGRAHPQGRRVVLLGDLVDRGPRNVDVLRLARRLVADGTALCVPGNHDRKFLRWLQGREVRISHGLERSIAEVEALPADVQASFRRESAEFLDGLISHFVLDEGRLVVAHAGMKREMQGRASPTVRDFALYGETTGEIDEYGLPVRANWAADYRGEALVVYGHTPVPRAEWLNNTICIDTGCVFGGRLTALRYPELELVDVPAEREWYPPIRPLNAEGSALSAQHEHDDVLDLSDVTGKRIVESRLFRGITLSESETGAALEAMSRFATNPRWIAHLPPTMSPPETSSIDGFLEHPDEALGYYRDAGVRKVICQEKHMGSRAIVVVCRDADTARERFGVLDDGEGAVLTRTGRRFFDASDRERAFLERVRAALSAAGFWERFASDWFVLDCELMPWSAKAQELLREQYAAVGAAATSALPRVVSVLEAATSRTSDCAPLVEKFRRIASSAESFVSAYRRYCWPVADLGDLRLAPFHLLAAEGRVFVDETHEWHMRTLAELAAVDPPWFVATPWRSVDFDDPKSADDAVAWWRELTERGGEGMVVKPWDFVVRGRRGLLQPAVKCRGREYLRIIYGPDYTADEHLSRLRQRGVGRKRALALREFALGIEALERFVRREPLRRVHECVFGVLALESDAVDPRL